MEFISLKKYGYTGVIADDTATRLLYATDASVYREVPAGVLFPQNGSDLKAITLWASDHKIAIIPRTAGTSLAGQVVGKGVIVDTGRYMNAILEICEEEAYAWVEPGVIRDVLNNRLKDSGLFFSPETSTSNRCMIGGMVGNNACGARSLKYGSVRDHILEVKGYFSNGEPVHFKALSNEELQNIAKNDVGVEGDLYRFLLKTLSSEKVKEEIAEAWPHPDIKRRNMGYALDIIAGMEPFTKGGDKFNFSKLIAGSEGTIMLMESVKIGLTPLPPAHKALLCAHFETLEEAYYANILMLEHDPYAVELVDKAVLDCTKNHQGYVNHRFFIHGDPAALLIAEFAGNDLQEIIDKAERIGILINKSGYGYYNSIVTGKKIEMVWDLRKAALGILSNM